MKIVFLDIDGVLNSWGTMVFFGTSTTDDPRFNPLAVKYLQSIVDDTGAKIVIHSSWMITFEYDEVIDMFVKLGFNRSTFLPLIGEEYNRVARIQTAMSEYSPEQYVIIDDTNLTQAFGENAIVVDPMDGLTYRNMILAKQLLGVTDMKVVML